MAIETNQFIGLSWRAGCDAQLMQQALARLEALTQGWWRVDRGERTIRAQPTAFHGSEEAAALCMNAPHAVGRDGRAHGPDSLFDRLRREGHEAAAMMAAPFAAVWLDPSDGNLRASTDAYGIGQLFRFESQHVSGVSNSAALLARVFGRGLDAQALTGFALFGAFQEADTPFDGITKVAPDCAISFSDARLVATPARRAARIAPASATTIRDVTECLRETVTRLSDAAPDADLQLSGGLDSRLILAALSPDRRRRHRALTIGPQHSPDVRIASAIAERFGMRHSVIDATEFDGLDVEGTEGLFRRAACGFDCSANPVDKAPLLLAESRIGSRSWFNGQNGEILRGFYYPGQPLDARASPALARRLLSWRLTVNDVVDARLFPGDAHSARRSVAEERAIARLLSFDGPWSTVLDRFYVNERMQRWAGNGIDNLINRVGYLCPFFDRDFVETAIALPANLKLNSRGAFQALVTLDRNLAELPLDTGVRPLSVVNSPFQARAVEMVQFAKKAAGRIRRKLTGGRRATLGSDAVAQHWRRSGLNARLPRTAMLATGLLDSSALDEIIDGRWLPDRPTLGFVLMMAELSELTG